LKQNYDNLSKFTLCRGEDREIDMSTPIFQARPDIPQQVQ